MTGTLSLAHTPVIVDVEPSPLDGKFYCEEKRAYFHQRGVVYVPVF